MLSYACLLFRLMLSGSRWLVLLFLTVHGVQSSPSWLKKHTDVCSLARERTRDETCDKSHPKGSAGGVRWPKKHQPDCAWGDTWPPSTPQQAPRPRHSSWHSARRRQHCTQISLTQHKLNKQRTAPQHTHTHSTTSGPSMRMGSQAAAAAACPTAPPTSASLAGVPLPQPPLPPSCQQRTCRTGWPR